LLLERLKDGGPGRPEGRGNISFHLPLLWCPFDFDVVAALEPGLIDYRAVDSPRF
jgi:hypothetical protein